MNDRLNMMVVLTEVIWKLKQYGNNFIAVFPIFPLPSKMFLNFSANNPLAGSWNQSDIERNAIWKSALHLPLIMSVHQEAARWISLDWSSSLKELLNEVVSIKQTFSLKTTSVKAIYKSSRLKVIGRHFLSKSKKKPTKEVHLW